MKCAACKYDSSINHLTTTMLIREEDKTSPPFKKIDLGKVTLFACPKCSTIRLEL